MSRVREIADEIWELLDEFKHEARQKLKSHEYQQFKQRCLAHVEPAIGSGDWLNQGEYDTLAEWADKIEDNFPDDEEEEEEEENLTIEEKLVEIADKVNGQVRTDYSGRGMFGRQCFAIVGPDSTEIVETASRYGLSGAKIDNMGLDWVVYWPNLEPKILT